MLQNQIVPVVSVVNNQPITNSLNIAAVFGKQHKDVLESIRSLNVPAEFDQRNFPPISYKDTCGRDQTAYNLTRDGFTLLVMGFTGRKAMQFKLAYIEEFNRMELELRRPANTLALPDQFIPNKLIPFRVNLVRATARPSWIICPGCGKTKSKWALGKKSSENPHGGFCRCCVQKIKDGTMNPEIEAGAMALWMFQELRPVVGKVLKQIAANA